MVAQREGHDVGSWCNVVALGIHRVILLEVVARNLHALVVKPCRFQLLGRQQRGMQPDAARIGVPRAPVVEDGHVVLYRAVVEDVAPRRFRGAWCRDDVTPAAVQAAFLGNDAAALKPHVAGTADEVDGTVNLRVLHIVLTLFVVRIVGVLVRQHAYAVADGSVAFVLQCHGASVRLGGIVVQVVPQRQVLVVVVPAAVLKDGGLADALCLDIGLIADDRSLHALSHEGDVMP